MNRLHTVALVKTALLVVIGPAFLPTVHFVAHGVHTNSEDGLASGLDIAELTEDVADPLHPTPETAELRLQIAFKNVLSGTSRAWAKRLDGTELAIAETFGALPKNTNGRLGVRSARHLLQKQFAIQHGWHLKGLKFHGFRRSYPKAIHLAPIIVEKARVLSRALRDARPLEHGFSFGDMVTLYAVIEQLILHESFQLLETAYKQNNQSTMGEISDKSLEDILLSYLMNQLGGAPKIITDVEAHRKNKQTRLEANISGTTSVKDMLLLVRDEVQNYMYAYRRSISPFAPRRFGFKIASQIAESLASRFGHWQDTECRGMMADLVKLDRQYTGRVPLGLLYKHPTLVSESVEYLRLMGTLDESEPTMPKLIIANYIVAPSNCVAPFKYHNICCISECESVVTQIEQMVRAPVGTAPQLLDIVANISSTSVDAPRILPNSLTYKMQHIAERHGGAIPIHGKLFLQWLHFAFPRDCPFPVPATNRVPSVVEHGTQEERAEYVNALKDYNLKRARTPALAQWDDVEMCPIHEQGFDQDSKLLYNK